MTEPMGIARNYDFTILFDTVNKQLDNSEVSEISMQELDEINNLRQMVIEVSQPNIHYYTTD